MLLINLKVHYLYRKYGVPLHIFFENWTRGISHLKQVKLMENISMRILRIYEIKRNSDIILRKVFVWTKRKPSAEFAKQCLKSVFPKIKLF